MPSIVLDDVLITPPVHGAVVPGVVRKSILALATEQGIETQERPVTIHDLMTAQEVFLTGTTCGILPVRQIEAHVVAEDTPGPITQSLRTAYADLTDSES